MRKNKVVEIRRQVPATVSSTTVQYLVCQKNHANDQGAPVFDGCQEFIASAEEGVAALICGACGCHRGYHKKYVHIEVIQCDSGCSHKPSTSGRWWHEQTDEALQCMVWCCLLIGFCTLLYFFLMILNSGVIIGCYVGQPMW